MSFESLSELYNAELEGAPESWGIVEKLKSQSQELAHMLDKLERNYNKLNTELRPKARQIFRCDEPGTDSKSG